MGHDQIPGGHGRGCGRASGFAWIAREDVKLEHSLANAFQFISGG